MINSYFDFYFCHECVINSFCNGFSLWFTEKEQMQDTVGMLVRERIVSRKLTRDLEGREILLDNQRRRVGKGWGGGVQTRKMHMGKMQPHLHVTCTTFSRGKVKQWL